MQSYKAYCQQFIDDINAMLTNSFSLANYMLSKTYLKGLPFSFVGHSYQEYITKLVEDNPGSTFVVKKCSQIGISELFNRIVLARMAIKSGTSALVSFPSKIFSQEVLKTRFAGIIQDSPDLSRLQKRDIDSASVKAFHNGSILYALGGNLVGNSSSGGSLLNRPIDTVFVDELDRQNPKVYTGYHSRMTHTLPHLRLIIYVSTPTAADIGIDAEFNNCRTQHIPQTQCESCGGLFEPDYYKDIRIPGFTEPLSLLTKQKAATLAISDSYLECPLCLQKVVNPEIVWKIERNPLGDASHIGIALTPFVAHEFIGIPELVKSSYTYDSNIEFLNQGLGRVANKRDTAIQRENIRIEFTPQENRVGYRVLGVDFGKLCYVTEGILRQDSTIFVDGFHCVRLTEVEDFIKNKFAGGGISAAVVDSGPYSDLVYRLVRTHPQLFSAVYVDPTTPMPELFKLKMDDKYGELVRQMTINKNKMMDMFANSLEYLITFAPSQYEAEFVQHILDMRRVRDYTTDEVVYKWVKSAKGVDHFFHSLIYLFAASKLAAAEIYKGTASAPVYIQKLRLATA
jgi:hypothetical protein